MPAFARIDLVYDRTVSGHDIYVPVGHPQYALRQLLYPALSEIKRQSLTADANGELFPQVLQTATVLQGQLRNAEHFGDNTPGMFDASGRAIPGHEQFSFGELVSFGLSGPEGHTGFLRECGLPLDTRYLTILLATALLLIDASVLAFELEETALALRLAADAHDWADEAKFASVEPSITRGEKFQRGGRGPGSLRKLIERTMKGKLATAPARAIWDACRALPRAKLMAVEFYNDTDAWADGRAVGFARFSNLVSEVRKQHPPAKK
jgi:hypothetical protein